MLARQRRTASAPARTARGRMRACASPPGPTTRCAPRSCSPRRATGPTKGEAIAQAQSIPLKFLENILGDLRHAGLVRSQRGADGGYWLGRPAADITVADVIRAVEGPLASVRGGPPEDVDYQRRGRAAAAGLDRRAGQPARRRRARHAGRRRRGPPARARDQAGRGSRGVGDALAPEIAATDYHTAGEPFRIVTAGVPPIAGRDGARAPRARGRVGGDRRACAGCSATSRAGTPTCTAASSSRPTTTAPTSACCSGTRTATRPRAGTGRSRSAPGRSSRARWPRRATARST